MELEGSIDLGHDRGASYMAACILPSSSSSSSSSCSSHQNNSCNVEKTLTWNSDLEKGLTAAKSGIDEHGRHGRPRTGSVPPTVQIERNPQKYGRPYTITCNRHEWWWSVAAVASRFTKPGTIFPTNKQIKQFMLAYDSSPLAQFCMHKKHRPNHPSLHYTTHTHTS